MTPIPPEWCYDRSGWQVAQGERPCIRRQARIPRRPQDEPDPIVFDHVLDEPDEDEEDDLAERREDEEEPPVRIGPPTGI